MPGPEGMQNHLAGLVHKYRHLLAVQEEAAVLPVPQIPPGSQFPAEQQDVGTVPTRSQHWQALPAWPGRLHHSCHPDGQEIEFPTTAARPAHPRHTGVGPLSMPSLTSRPEATSGPVPQKPASGMPAIPLTSHLGKWPQDQWLTGEGTGMSAWAPKK